MLGPNGNKGCVACLIRRFAMEPATARKTSPCRSVTSTTHLSTCEVRDRKPSTGGKASSPLGRAWSRPWEEQRRVPGGEPPTGHWRRCVALWDMGLEIQKHQRSRATRSKKNGNGRKTKWTCELYEVCRKKKSQIIINRCDCRNQTTFADRRHRSGIGVPKTHQ